LRYLPSQNRKPDGSLIDGCAGFAIHRTEVGGFGNKILIPAGIFTAEFTALFVTLRHVSLYSYHATVSLMKSNLFIIVLSM
jgi:hypothetical protein